MSIGICCSWGPLHMNNKKRFRLHDSALGASCLCNDEKCPEREISSGWLAVTTATVEHDRA